MDEFPFTEAEWTLVDAAAADIVNASLMEDVVLRSVAMNVLNDVLHALAERHGEHPVLLETAADFASDPIERCALYRRALMIAEAHGLETKSILAELSKGRPSAILGNAPTAVG